MRGSMISLCIEPRISRDDSVSRTELDTPLGFTDGRYSAVDLPNFIDVNRVQHMVASDRVYLVPPRED